MSSALLPDLQALCQKRPLLFRHGVKSCYKLFLMIVLHSKHGAV